jgi:hypothetical protein
VAGQCPCSFFIDQTQNGRPLLFKFLAFQRHTKQPSGELSQKSKPQALVGVPRELSLFYLGRGPTAWNGQPGMGYGMHTSSMQRPR